MKNKPIKNNILVGSLIVFFFSAIVAFTSSPLANANQLLSTPSLTPQAGSNALTGGVGLWPPSANFPRLPPQVSQVLGAGNSGQNKITNIEKSADATCNWQQKKGHEQFKASGCVQGYYQGQLPSSKQSNADVVCKQLFRSTQDARYTPCLQGYRAGVQAKTTSATKNLSEVTGRKEWQALCNALKKINQSDARRLAASECKSSVGQDTTKISNARSNICKEYGGDKLKNECDNLKKAIDDELGIPEDSDDQEPPSCESGGFNLSWILCPFIEGMAQAIDSMYDNIIQPLLYTDPINITEPNKDDRNTFAIWSTFRIYGNVILVIALLVIIFGEAIGGGLVDAYTVRKTLPRILVAAILINLSIYIVALAVDVSNVVGVGIQSLMETPFRAADSFEMHLGFGTSVASGIGLTGLVGVGALIWASGGTLLLPFIQFLLMFFLLPAFLGIMAVMITILIREGLIIFLTIVSPVAFALYCMPNTEKYFKQWWDLLFRTLLVFPIIAVVFAMGNILAVTINSTASGITGALTEIMSVFALVLPLFLIPFSFRIAGGVMGQISGIVQDRKGRIAAPINKWRNRRAMQSLGEIGKSIKEDRLNPNATRSENNTRQRRFGRSLSNLSHIEAVGKSGWSRAAMRQDMNTAREDSHIAHLRHQEDMGAGWAVHSGNDTMLKAMEIAHFEGDQAARDYLMSEDGGGMNDADANRNMASIKQMQRKHGSGHLASMATMALPATGTGNSRGIREVNGEQLITGGAGQTIDDLVRQTEDDAGFGSGWSVAGAGYAKGNRHMDSGAFGTALAGSHRLRAMRARGASQDEIDREIHNINLEMARAAIHTKGPMAAAQGRGQDAEAAVGAINEEIRLAEQAVRDAQTSPDGMVDIERFDEATQTIQTHRVDRAGAERHYAQVMGQVASLNENIGSFVPENQVIVANGLFDQQVDVASLPPEIRRAVATPTAHEGPLRPGEARQVSLVEPATLTRAEFASRMERSAQFGGVMSQVKRNWGANMTAEQRAAAVAAGADPSAMGPNGPEGEDG